MVSAGMIWAYGVSGAAVLLLGVGLCAGHRLRSSAGFMDYLWGAGTWSVTVAAKYPLAAVVYGVLYLAFPAGIPIVADMLSSGLLTGATECVGIFLVARTKRWRRASWDSTVAFGLAKGCFEAVVLAGFILLLAVVGACHRQLKPEDAQAVLAGLADPYRPVTFLIERAVAVPVHLLSSVLIIRAAQVGKSSLFWWGFGLMSLVDAVPDLPAATLYAIYVVFGVASCLVLFRYSSAVRSRAHHSDGSETAENV